MNALHASLIQADACIDRGDWSAAAQALVAYDAAVRAAVGAGDPGTTADWLALRQRHAALQLKLQSLQADTLVQLQALQRERVSAQRCLTAYAA